MFTDIFIKALGIMAAIATVVVAVFVISIIGSFLYAIARDFKEEKSLLNVGYAKWIWKNNNTNNYVCVCSNCNKEGKHSYSYCPNCGAKMDLKRIRGSE